jgi:hypothetical protein
MTSTTAPPPVEGGPLTAGSTPVRPGSAALVSAVLLGVNALSYAFTTLAARALAPHAYGELAALLSLSLVGAVPGMGLQTAAALHLGGARGDRAALLPRLHATALAAAGLVAVVGAAAVAPTVALLHLPGPAAAEWLVVLLLGHTVVGGYEGALQGIGRYGRLAAVTTTFGVAKVAGGVLGLLLGRTPAWAMAGMALGAALGTAVGWLLSGRPGIGGELAGPARSALRASSGLLGFVALLNLDLLLARHHLAPGVAGEYAVAAVVAKAAFWLPQGIGVVLLPRLAHAGTRRRTVGAALAVVAAVGLVLTVAATVLGGRVVEVVGGSAYGSALGALTGLFAVLGTLLAAAQLLLYSGIAAADRASTTAVWLAVVAELAVVEGLAATGRLSAGALVVTATAVSFLLVAAGLAGQARSGRGARAWAA